MANITKLTSKKKEEFLSYLREMPNVSRACRLVGLSRTAMYFEREEDPEFAAAWEEALREGVEALEEAAWIRAQSVSDTLAIFLLKAHAPEKYLERRDVTSGGKPLSGITYIEVVLPEEEDENTD